MKKLSLYIMAALYVLAGINHFLNPPFYQAIMPTYIGYHTILIYVSGVCEIVLGLLLIPQTTRKAAATLIIMMLVVFLWLHIQMLIDFSKTHDKRLWIAIIRIPMQFILIWWAYPFARPSEPKQ
jgi:uncharacterized membrane protein